MIMTVYSYLYNKLMALIFTLHKTSDMYFIPSRRISRVMC